MHPVHKFLWQTATFFATCATPQSPAHASGWQATPCQTRWSFAVVEFVALAQRGNQPVNAFGIDFLRKLGAVVVHQPNTEDVEVVDTPTRLRFSGFLKTVIDGHWVCTAAYF